MEVTAAELQQRYSSAPDELLLEALAAGPSSYTHLAWSIISREAQNRGLSLRVLPDSTSTPPAPLLKAPNPFFFWSRVVQQTRWDHSARSLPLRGLYFLGGGWALVGFWVFVDVANGLGRTVTSVLFGLLLDLPFVLVLVACLAPRRPWKWYYLMFFTVALMPLAHFADYAGRDQGVEWLLFIYPLVLLTWPLYLARRRLAFGLGVWQAFM